MRRWHIKKEFKKINELIKKHENIFLFHHAYPDPDSLGAQTGFYYWLLDNFPKKKIILVGKDFIPDNIQNFTKLTYLSDDKNIAIPSSSLGILLDTNDILRSSSKLIQQCTTKVCIDHHPVVNNEWDFSLVKTERSSTCELLYYLLSHGKKKHPLNCLEQITFGVITDTGRFLHSNTTKDTFDMISKIVERGVDLNKIYDQLYSTPLSTIKYRSEIINNMQIKNNIAWSIMSDKAMKKHRISFSEAKNQVFAMSGIEGIKTWVLFTENIDEGNYKVSLRSKNINVNEIAKMYNGGGHKYASGAVVKDEKEIIKLIKSIEKQDQSNAKDS